MRPISDHFSDSAAGYAGYRPTYPPALFAWLAQLAPSRSCALDCATGSGQAARGLSPHFARVVAGDASLQQVLHATEGTNVDYVVMRAEQLGVATESVSLVCAAQALHWFDRPAFYDDVRRVLQPGGLLAVWQYGLMRIEPGIDMIIDRFYRETVGPYWPPERRIVDAGYATIDFPFAEVAVPDFVMDAWWTLPQLAGYLRTWSAVSRSRAVLGMDPVATLVEELMTAWGNPLYTRRVRWPLDIRAGTAATALMKAAHL